MVIAGRFLPAEQGQRPQRLDLSGVAALSIALLLLVVPLVLGQDEGWPAWIWVCLVASIPAFALFIALEHRLTARGGSAVINLRLLARPSISWGLVTLAAANATYFAILFILALYLQQGLGQSPTYSGLTLVPWVAAFGVAGPLVGRLSPRGRRLAGPGGACLLAMGYVGIPLVTRRPQLAWCPSCKGDLRDCQAPPLTVEAAQSVYIRTGNFKYVV